jgi:hypothetical protein
VPLLLLENQRGQYSALDCDARDWREILSEILQAGTDYWSISGNKPVQRHILNYAL